MCVRANFERKPTPRSATKTSTNFHRAPHKATKLSTSTASQLNCHFTQPFFFCEELNCIMESLLRQGKQVCPFLKRNTPATLRMLAMSLHTTKRGYTVSGLQNAAAHCPVIGKAIATQQAKRPYVTKTEPVAVARSVPNRAESISLAEAHRAAGVTDLSKGS
jgi:hypothetical protein